eukprot:scaffold1704_cov246-Pinguiococcus_pyrenoidosus.AAC.14
MQRMQQHRIFRGQALRSQRRADCAIHFYASVRRVPLWRMRAYSERLVYCSDLHGVSPGHHLYPCHELAQSGHHARGRGAAVDGVADAATPAFMHAVLDKNAALSTVRAAQGAKRVIKGSQSGVLCLQVAINRSLEAKGCRQNVCVASKLANPLIGGILAKQSWTAHQVLATSPALAPKMFLA